MVIKTEAKTGVEKFCATRNKELFPCSNCEQTFSTCKNLTRHILKRCNARRRQNLPKHDQSGENSAIQETFQATENRLLKAYSGKTMNEDLVEPLGCSLAMQCNICQRLTSNRFSLLRHLKLVHKVVPKSCRS